MVNQTFCYNNLTVCVRFVDCKSNDATGIIAALLSDNPWVWIHGFVSGVGGTVMFIKSLYRDSRIPVHHEHLRPLSDKPTWVTDSDDESVLSDGSGQFWPRRQEVQKKPEGTLKNRLLRLRFKKGLS